MAKKSDGKKGTFTFLRLPIAKKYVWPESRLMMFGIGGMACLLLIAYFGLDLLLKKGSFISNGPVSSFHASFEKDCSSCHEPVKGVTNAKCSVCHELVGDTRGTYTFAAHYQYRSGDTKRGARTASKETPCFSCHTEHTGRTTRITEVEDARCLRCHDYGSFNDRHPQFSFITQKIPDDQNLEFQHIPHVRQVMAKKNLKDIEKACLYCHRPEPDGKHFQPISFDQTCDACHLTITDKTPPLPTNDPSTPGTIGVETLEQIQASNEPGTKWAFFMSTSEFQKRGGGLVKSPLYHEDPWIMENLRLIRRKLYQNEGLADLLMSAGLTGGDAESQTKEMYQEAVKTLKEYATELRGSPQREVQDDLSKIDQLIRVVERKIENPSEPLDAQAFLPKPRVNPSLTPAQVDQLKTLSLDLTEPCRKCHIVSDASILRVQKDQSILHRAEFNHKAHVLQRRCLDCHNRIDIEGQLKVMHAIDPAKDNAGIQNIPGIENCQACHQKNLVSNHCVTCHEFHPDKNNRSRMLLYLD
jgi:hypothetical protein